MDSPKKICSQCTQEKLPTDFGVDAREADGRRRVCKECYGKNRSAKATREEKALKIHAKIVADAKRRLAQPEKLSAGELHKLDQIVRLDEERIEKLREKVAEHQKAEEAAEFAQAANPSLARVRALGSSIFAADGTLLSVSDRAAQLAIFKAALTTLTGAADATARDYVNSNIRSLEEMVGNTAARETFLAEDEQERLNESACFKVANQLKERYAGLFDDRVSRAAKDKLIAAFKTFRAKAQAHAKAVKSGEKTASGANRKAVASQILETLTEIATRLGHDTTTSAGPQQTLANVQSFDWNQATSAHSMRQYVQRLQAKLEQERATLTPKEFEEKYLKLPVAPKEETVVWRARLLNGSEQWFWNSGAIVRRGVDVGTSDLIKDPLHGWCLAPEPASVAIDDKPVGPMEAYQDEMDCDAEGYPKWKYRPQGSGGEFVQGPDGSWSKVRSGESPWDEPTKVTFKMAAPQPDAEHDEFRNGFWWTKSECEAAERGPDLETPPVILPPLERTNADSIAVEPPMTAEEIAKENREPNRWRRHEDRMKQEKEREAAMLRGVFKWDKTQATAS